MSSKQTTPEAPLRNHHDWRRFVAKAAVVAAGAVVACAAVVAGAAAVDAVGAAVDAVAAAGAATTAKVVQAPFSAFLEGRRSWQMAAMWSKDRGTTTGNETG